MPKMDMPVQNSEQKGPKKILSKKPMATFLGMDVIHPHDNTRSNTRAPSVAGLRPAPPSHNRQCPSSHRCLFLLNFVLANM